MKPTLKRWIADWIPPHLRRLLRAAPTDNAVRYSGNFATWDDARRKSQGYEAHAIVERVKQAMQKIQRGEAAYERDSVVFDRVEHSFPLLTGLLRAALATGGPLTVVDVGGSLGSTYFQCRSQLDTVTALRWNVVEQPLFAKCGREHFQSEQLHFYDDLQTSLNAEPPDVAILSSVLPYVEAPHALLEAVSAAHVPRVIIDRTPIWNRLPDRLTVQSVPPSIYGFQASYPAWILNRECLLEHFARNYRLVFEFEALAGTVMVDGAEAKDTGFLFERQ